MSDLTEKLLLTAPGLLGSKTYTPCTKEEVEGRESRDRVGDRGHGEGQFQACVVGPHTSQAGRATSQRGSPFMHLLQELTVLWLPWQQVCPPGEQEVPSVAGTHWVQLR